MSHPGSILPIPSSFTSWLTVINFAEANLRMYRIFTMNNRYIVSDTNVYHGMGLYEGARLHLAQMVLKRSDYHKTQRSLPDPPLLLLER